MNTFEYTARANATHVIRGSMDADSSTSVARSLRSQGIFPLEISQQPQTKRVFPLVGSGQRRRVKIGNLAEFTEQFAGLLDAGVPVERAMRLLSQQIPNRTFKEILPGIAESIREGKSLAQALELYPKAFPATYISMIQVGEQAGILVDILKRLARTLDEQDQLHSKIKGAMIYPAFLCSVGLVTIMVLMTWVIPKFSTFFGSLGQQLPLPTRVVIKSSAIIGKTLPFIVVAVLVIVFLCIRLLRISAVRLYIDRIALRFPILGAFWAKSQLIQLMRTLGTLLTHGVSMLSALGITGATLSNRYFAGEVRDAAQRLTHGGKLHECFALGTVFPDSLIGLLAIGQESGNLPQMLTRVGEQYEQQMERQIRSMTSMIEPVMVLVMGGIVGFVVVAMLMPVFRASALVK